MKPEFFRALFLQDPVRVRDLLRCHAVLCISRVIHNIIADLKQSARVITAADRLRNMPDSLFQKINMGDIIQIDNCSQLIRKNKIFRRSIIGGKHNVMSCHANCF